MEVFQQWIFEYNNAAVNNSKIQYLSLTVGYTSQKSSIEKIKKLANRGNL